MMFAELVTLIQNRLPVKVIVFNNSSLNFVEVEMKAAGVVNFGTELVNPNFADVAQAMVIFARRVEQPHQLQQALAEAFAYDGPAVRAGPVQIRLKARQARIRVPEPDFGEDSGGPYTPELGARGVMVYLGASHAVATSRTAALHRADLGEVVLPHAMVAGNN